MNEPQLQPGQIQKEKLLGVVDIKEIYHPGFHDPLSGEIIQGTCSYEACFRYEILTMRQIMGGALIIDHTEYRDEWRKVTKDGCFPRLQQQYQVT